MEKFFINSKNICLTENEIIFDGKNFNYEFHKLSENINFIRINGFNFIFNSDNENGQFYIFHNGKRYDIECKSEKDLIREKLLGGNKKKKYASEIKSPMPGSIVKLNVKEGDEIIKGQVLLVLEAMKMENEIKATHNSKIKKIFVKEKDSVDKGHLLINFE